MATVAASVLASVLLIAGCAGATQPAGTTPTHAATTTIAATTINATSAVQRPPHIVVFTATGTAHVDSVTYVVDGRSATASAVTLPWRQTLNLPADGAMHNYSMTIDFHGGSVQALAIEDGATVDSTDGSSTGTGNAQLSGSFAG